MDNIIDNVTEKIKELETAVQAFVDASAKFNAANAEACRTASVMSSTAAELVRDIKGYHNRRSEELRSLHEALVKQMEQEEHE